MSRKKFTKATRSTKFKMSGNIEEKIEDKIIDCINFDVGGRLVIFKPEKNRFGADLVVEKRAKYKGGKEIYFKVSGFVLPAKNIDFAQDFPRESFKADENFYLLFVYFDEVRQKLNDHAWLVPSIKFMNEAEVVETAGGQKFLRFKAPANLKENSKYSKFLIDTRNLGKMALFALENGGEFNFA